MPDIGTEFVAIDEIQLCADPQRGHVFTERLLHARGTHETLLAKTVDEVKKLDDSLSRVKDEETSKAAVEQIGRYRAAMLDVARKQAALPPLTRNQQAKLMGVQQQLVEMMQPIVKHVTAIMLSPDASRNLKEALNSLSELPKEVQKIREEAAK